MRPHRGKTAEARRRQIEGRRNYMNALRERRIENSIEGTKARWRQYKSGVSLPEVTGPSLEEIEAKYGK